MDQQQASLAILILAHKDLQQVTRLVAHLESSFDVFIHVDRRSHLTAADFHGFPRTTVIKKFIAGWGSLGIVRSTIELLKLSSERGKYDRFVLISGQDVPLKPNDEIQDFFSRHPRTEFVDSRPFTPGDASRLTRLSHFHFFSRKSLGGSFTRWTADLSRRLDRVLWTLGIRREMIYRFRWGSQWMDLTGDSVARILKFLRDDKAFLKRFKFTFCPDEVFFQTALEHCMPSDLTLMEPQRFTDWTSGPEHPRVLRREDLERVKNSGMLFARKCDPQIDAQVIEDLYNSLKRAS